MAEFSSPLSRENRLQLARSTFSSSAITGGRSLSISPLVSGSPIQQDPETLRLLENNQTELSTISSGIFEIRNSVELLNQSLNSVSSAFFNSSILEQNRESQRRQQERILAEDALRDETEALIERKAESSINNTVQPIAQKTTGTLNSLMGVFGSLFLGWLGTGGIQQVQTLIRESGDRFSRVKDTVGSSLRFIGDGLLNLKNGFDSTIANITRVTTSIKDAVVKGLIIAPFKAMFGGAKGASSGAASGAVEGGTKGATTPPPKSPSPATAEGAAKGATSEAAESGVKRAATEAGETGIGKFLRGGLVSAAFGGLDFMQRKNEGQTTTQAAAGAGGGVFGAEVGALTGARVGSLFGPLGAFGGAVLGGAGGWMFGSGMADRFTGVSEKKEQPQPKVQPQSTPQTPPQPSKPPASLQPPAQPQAPILTPDQTKMSEDKAETVTPKANFNVNFGDQISNYTNKLFGQSQQPVEPQDTSNQMPDWMKSMRESTKSFNMPFDFGETEKISAEGQYKLPEVSQLPKSNIPKETTFGPLPEPSPNIIVAPMMAQQNSGSKPIRNSGSASDVPNISSSNPDNFYVLYSKTQYNVMA